MTQLQSASPSVSSAAKAPGYWRSVGQRLTRDRVGIASALVLLAIVVSALAAPLIAPHDPNSGSVMTRLSPIGTPGHLLGTDATGRDILSRLIWGGRLSLLSGITPVVLATLIGGTLGIIAGMSGRLVNGIIMRITDIFFAFPSILLAVAISGVLGNGLGNTLVSLTVVFVPQVLRVAESATVQIARQDYVDAAPGTTASRLLIMTSQVLPNVLSPILVFATSLIAVSLVVAAGLNFIGLGVAPPAVVVLLATPCSKYVVMEGARAEALQALASACKALRRRGASGLPGADGTV